MKVPRRKPSLDQPALRDISVICRDRSVSTEQRLALVRDTVSEGYWEWSASVGATYYGQGCLASLGYGRDLTRDQRFVESLIHPDDLLTFRSSMADHLAGKSEECVVECRMRAKSGQYLWFRHHGRVVDRARGGRPTRIVGMILDVNERKQAQEQFAISQAHLSAIYESTDDLIWSVEPEDFRLLAYSRAYSRHISTGRGIAVRAGMRPEDVTPHEHAEALKRLYKKALEKGRIECDYKTVSGFTLHLVCERLDHDGRTIGVLVVGHDITERIRMEQAVRKAEEKFAMSFLESPMALTLIRVRDQHYIEVNEAFLELTGYQRDDVIGRTPFELGICQDPDDNNRLVEQVKTTGRARNTEVRYRTKSGEIRQGLRSAALIEIDGEACLVSVIADITDRKRAEEALRDSEERLRLATESGRMYAFEWNPRTDIIERSPESQKILGKWPQGKVFTTGQQFIEGIKTDDRQRFIEAIKSVSPDKPQYKASYRWVRPDQSIIWLEETGKAFFDESANMLRIVGMVSDVTEVRQSASALRELSGRLITSQEVERRRVARELHDNIGQELALLAVQARRLDAGASDEDQTSHVDVRELYKRIKDIATMVSTLSHQLHSSELDFLGLEAAVERLCRDFTNKHRIDIEYEIKNVPRKLDAGVSLCFYRIMQEALQNVARHSKATRVTVELTGSGDELTLKVADNGIGFDIQSAQMGPGLGLVSMRERVKLVGGRIMITSEAKRGTELYAGVAISLQHAL